MNLNLEAIRMGTEAHHDLGDLSRSKPDYFRVEREDEDNYYGYWLTGLGFINVRFPKSTSRPMNIEEMAWLSTRTLVV